MSPSSTTSMRSAASPSRTVVSHHSSSVPVSRLQLMQARFQSKLLQEKQQKMLQLFPNNNNNNNSNNGGGLQHHSSPQGGTVRQFFAQRRALQGSFSGSNNNNNSNGFLNNSMGPASLNGSWSPGTFSRAGPKQGSPVGWDKSYPLSPLDRDGAGNSNGFNNFGSGSQSMMSMPHTTTVKDNKRMMDRVGRGTDRQKGSRAAPAANHWRSSDAAAAKPGRRAPSLDRYGGSVAKNQDDSRGPDGGAMRRTNSQILATSIKEKENIGITSPSLSIPQQHKNQGKVEAVAPSNVAQKQRTVLPTKQNSYSTGQRGPHGSPPFDTRDGGVVAQAKPKKSPIPDIQYKSPTKPNAPVQQKQTLPPRRTTSSAADPNLAECAVCGRHFAKDRISKHESICKKSTAKKRKPFDPTKMRLKGTELEEFARKSAKAGQRHGAVQHQQQEQQHSSKKSDWRSKHSQFIEAIRQAKAVQKHLAAGGKVSDLPQIGRAHV